MGIPKNKDKLLKMPAYWKAIAHPVRLCLVKKLSREDRLTVSYFVSVYGRPANQIFRAASGQAERFGHSGPSRKRRGNHVKYSLASEKVRKIVKTDIRGGNNE